MPRSDLDAYASNAPALSIKSSGRFDELQFRYRFWRSLFPPLIDDALVVFGECCIVLLERMLNRSQACQNADQMEAESVATELPRDQLIEAPLSGFQIHSRLGKLRHFASVIRHGQ
jgi:hypothetical protein